MISGQTLRVCPEGKPVPTFPDHALGRRARLALALDDLKTLELGMAQIEAFAGFVVGASMARRNSSDRVQASNAALSTQVVCDEYSV